MPWQSRFLAILGTWAAFRCDMIGSVRPMLKLTGEMNEASGFVKLFYFFLNELAEVFQIWGRK